MKGALAKETLINKIKEALPEAFIGESDKKYYFWSEENGEKMQIAVSFTCPKTPLTVVRTSLTDDHDFGNAQNIVVPPSANEITQEERDNIARLSAALR